MAQSRIGVFCFLILGFYPCISIADTLFGIPLDDRAFSNIPWEDRLFTKEIFESLEAGDVETIAGHVHNDLINDVRDQLPLVISALGLGEPLSKQMLEWQMVSNEQGNRHTILCQYRFPNIWVAVSLVFKTWGTQKKIIGLSIEHNDKPLHEVHAFAFFSKTAFHYLFLFLTVCVVVFCAATLVICIRSDIGKKKWLWNAFILTGEGKFCLNWTTADYGFEILDFQFPLYTFSKDGDYSPWIICIWMPVGAIVFLLRRKALLKKAHEPVEEDNQIDDFVRRVREQAKKQNAISGTDQGS